MNWAARLLAVTVMAALVVSFLDLALRQASPPPGHLSWVGVSIGWLDDPRPTPLELMELNSSLRLQPVGRSGELSGIAEFAGEAQEGRTVAQIGVLLPAGSTLGTPHVAGGSEAGVEVSPPRHVDEHWFLGAAFEFAMTVATPCRFFRVLVPFTVPPGAWAWPDGLGSWQVRIPVADLEAEHILFAGRLQRFIDHDVRRPPSPPCDEEVEPLPLRFVPSLAVTGHRVHDAHPPPDQYSTGSLASWPLQPNGVYSARVDHPWFGAVARAAGPVLLTAFGALMGAAFVRRS